MRERIQMDKRMREKKTEKTEIQDGGEEEDSIVQSIRFATELGFSILYYSILSNKFRFECDSMNLMSIII